MKDGVIIGHCEGHRRGIASNHSDPDHWFSRHGKSMDSFRADVKTLLAGAAPAVGSGGSSDYDPNRGADHDADHGTDHGAAPNADPGVAPGADHDSGTGADSAENYTVRKGDTLWRIASEKLGSGARYTEIKALNGLTSDTLIVGRVLKIPTK
jgi:nucleoid-associated protein YgaU